MTGNEEAYFNPASSQENIESLENNWLVRNKSKLVIGGLAVGFAISLPQLNETVDGLKDSADWAIPALVTTELAWNIGAATMLVSAGKKVGNPLTLKARLNETKDELKDSKAFRIGMTTNLAGALGTSAIITAGSIAELPPTTWPSTFLVAGLSAAPSVAIWKSVYGSKSSSEEVK